MVRDRHLMPSADQAMGILYRAQMGDSNDSWVVVGLTELRGASEVEEGLGGEEEKEGMEFVGGIVDIEGMSTVYAVYFVSAVKRVAVVEGEELGSPIHLQEQRNESHSPAVEPFFALTVV